MADRSSNITEVHAKLVSTPPARQCHQSQERHLWVAVADALKAEVRLYDRLFSVLQPDTTEKDFLEELNPDSLKVVQGYVEPSLATAKGDDRFQFERHGYFVADRADHAEGRPVFNRVAGMKDSWGK